ncbi:TAXI family TRAP transporter solute-binding subunit [Ammoniphilus sp. CFH 90114]|uniref:TAXI family TRAP transporter solute-binding subunit n=1 Tax=Ammoniphilus sp. CFH 90114 TaxID=2493665 RepID=UPI00100DEAD4|nr:TAXI family TRAP transporter solute-binding subunit [Ammoniphilus sp. CFH 90114]RXT07218.1 TAXI family TRAP transporter solute-binding subunit [Ammoniphilus sp. CFH 90114]
MRNSKWFVTIVCFILSLSTILAGCGSSSTSTNTTSTPAPSSPTDKPSDQTSAPAPAASESPKKQLFLNVATATTAGVYYALGNGMADLWNQKVEGVRASAQATAGSPQNVKLMSKKEAHVAFVQNGIAYEAWNGVGQFEGSAEKDIRALTYLYPNLCYFVVRADSGINSLSDIKGKTIAPGPVGSGTELNAREILSIVGIDYKDGKDAKAQYVGNAESAQMLLDNQVDVTYISGGLPHASVVEMATSKDVKILPVEGEVRDKLMEKYSWYFPVTIPANSFKGQSEAIETVAVANLLLGRADLDEDVVYSMIKSVYDNKEQLAASFKGASKMKPEEGLNGVTLPLHPGAVKYFKEQGLQIPDSLIQ